MEEIKIKYLYFLRVDFVNDLMTLLLSVEADFTYLLL